MRMTRYLYVEECLKTLRNSLDTINHFTLIGK